MDKLSYPTIVCSIITLNGCVTEPSVGFQSDISPMLQDKCQQCHLPPSGEGYVKTGLSLESYDTLMSGTVFGAVIIPGDSKRSVINKLAEGRAGEMMRMPHGDATRLTEREVELLKLWVDQGAINN